MQHNYFLHRFFIATIPCIMLVSSLQAQYVNDYKKNADNFYQKGDYYSAALYYEKFMEGKGNVTAFAPYQAQKETSLADNAAKKSKTANTDEIAYRLAESYRHLTDQQNAEKWYAKVLASPSNKNYPLARFYYAEALSANKKIDAANQQYDAFLKEYPKKDEFTALAQKHISDGVYALQQMDKADAKISVVKLNDNINPKGLNYAPSGFGNTFVFTSARPDSSNKVSDPHKQTYVNRLFQANITTLSEIKKLPIPSIPNVDQGIATFTDNGKVAFFTRWTKKDGKKSAAIYSTQFSEGAWQQPEKLGATVNVDGYNSQQPNVTPDGKFLIFSSDQPGGQGKYDLWYTRLNAAFQPQKAFSFGATINTAQDEQTPYYHAPSNTLVFASNGIIGMGGFDLYSTKGTLGTNNFSQPQNLGYPVNSIKDDIYFYNAGNKKLLKEAFISTDRASACCLEIFAVNKAYGKTVTGNIIDCKTKQPLSQVSLKASDDGNNPIAKPKLTNAQGVYFYDIEEAVQSITISATKENYQDATQPIALPTSDDKDTIAVQAICLTMNEPPPPPPPPAPEEKPKAEVPLYTHFAFNKYAIHPDSTAIIDSVVALLKRETKLGVDIGGYTDDIGTVEYNLKLADLRANASKEYFIKQGISSLRIKTKAYGKCCPLVPDTINGKDNPDGRAQNRRVEYRIFYRQ